MPRLNEVAAIEAETFRLLPSPELTIPDLFALADAVERAVATGARGAVITHGTDTMEESAFVLDRILALDAPVVLTGAMRNPTLAGPDGPANLLDAVCIATHEPGRIPLDTGRAARLARRRHAAAGRPLGRAPPGRGAARRRRGARRPAHRRARR